MSKDSEWEFVKYDYKPLTERGLYVYERVKDGALQEHTVTLADTRGTIKVHPRTLLPE